MIGSVLEVRRTSGVSRDAPAPSTSRNKPGELERVEPAQAWAGGAGKNKEILETL
jgi:hypothetical protein